MGRGSASRRGIASTNCPGRCKSGREDPMRLFRKILVPHDGSEPATRALKLAAELARARRGRLLVLHAVPPYFVAGTPPAEAAWIPSADFIAQERRRLETIAGR